MEASRAVHERRRHGLASTCDRLGSFARRHSARLFRAWRNDRYPLAAERTWQWLTAVATHAGLPAHDPSGDPCPGTTALAIRCAADYGRRRPLMDWVPWLLDTQLPSGAVPDSLLRRPSRFNTVQAALAWRRAEGCLRVLPDGRAQTLVKQCEAAVSRATSWLVGSSFGPGFLKVPSTFTVPSQSLIEQAAFAQSLSEYCRHLRWPSAQSLGGGDLLGLIENRTAAHWAAEALLDQGRLDDARRLATLAESHLGPTSVLRPTRAPTHDLAHLATVLFRLGESDRASRRLRAALRRQHSNGEFPRDGTDRFQRSDRRPSVLAALHVLRALQAQVQAEFAGAAPRVETTADEHSDLSRCIRRWAMTIPAGVAAEIGCGRGRWFEILTTASSGHVEWLAIDSAPQLCFGVERAAAIVAGSACDLPMPTGSLQAVLAVEVLEHALDPQQALAELCRVLRPGGRLLVVDKPLSRQALSYCQPWERWFDPAELTRWLAPYCHEVHCEPLFDFPHTVRRRWAGHEAPTMLAWHAVRGDAASAVSQPSFHRAA